MTADYTDLGTIKSELKVTDASQDTRLARIITAVSREIDNKCGFPKRQFFQTQSPPEIRYFTAAEAREIEIDDFTSLTSVQADIDGDGIYENTWTEGTSYLTLPNNAAAYGKPYTTLKFPTFAVTIMPIVEKGLKVTGTFGWPSVPALVQEACILWCIHAAGLRNAPFGIAEVPAIDGGGMRIGPMPPGVKNMLAEYARDPITVG